jgi:hypothetical protein
VVLILHSPSTAQQTLKANVKSKTPLDTYIC